MIINKKTSELELGDFARPVWLVDYEEDFREVVHNEPDDYNPSIWYTSTMGISGLCQVVETLDYELWLVNVAENS
jgi:hypothetical protein